MPNTRSFKPKSQSSDVSRQSSASLKADSEAILKTDSSSGAKVDPDKIGVDVDELVGNSENSEKLREPERSEKSETPELRNSDVSGIQSHSESFRNDTYRPRYGNGYGNGNGYSERDRDVPTEDVSGVLDIMPEGHGFLRPKYTPSDKDVYISASQIRRFNLRVGDFVEGAARPPKESERYFGLLQVNTVNGTDAEKFVTAPGGGPAKRRTKFEDLTAIYPNKLLKLETGKTPLSQRVIDLIAPIGFGQRGLIVSPPKAGKTTILKEIAAGITVNHPDVILMAVLVGERPEEVTDLSRSIKGDVISSNFDEAAEDQTTAAEIALERAKRLVEEGKDVVILLDSITRLGRAYNLSVPPSGRTLTGGFDPAALYPPKRFFGAARNCEEGGSLTIIGTALVDTGSRMDDLIYEEFKGTGNMELHLDRFLSERRVFPSINIKSSGTRQEQLLFAEEEYKKVVVTRRMLGLLPDDQTTEVFLERLAKTATNKEFLDNLKDVR